MISKLVTEWARAHNAMQDANEKLFAAERSLGGHSVQHRDAARRAAEAEKDARFALLDAAKQRLRQKRQAVRGDDAATDRRARKAVG